MGFIGYGLEGAVISRRAAEVDEVRIVDACSVPDTAVHTISEAVIKHVADLSHARHPLTRAPEIRMRKLRKSAAAALQGFADGTHGFLTHAVSLRKLSNQFIGFH